MATTQEEKKTFTVEDGWTKLNETLQQLMTRGMEGMSGNAWPVLIRNGGMYQREEYRYPETFFRNLKQKYKLYLPYDKKSDRVYVLKQLIDQQMSGEIDVMLFHLGEYCIYSGNRDWTSYRDDFTEKSLGKRRVDHLNQLPRSSFMNNDEFLASNWSYLVDRRYPEVGQEIRRNPSLSEVRMLFTPDIFGSHNGTHYSNADWVEPISGDRDLGVKKFLAEKDPMAPQANREDMIEGRIALVPQLHNGNRHYVQDTPIHAGSYIEVRFGDGWIAGRYEWSFQSEEPIQIHAGNEVIYIREGHTVRVRK